LPIRTFPFNSGVQQSVDIRLLPDGMLADAVNVELDRQGRMVVRPGYTAVATTVYGTGALVAYDLFTLNDRLFAMGDAHSYGFPCDIYELLPTGGAARWRPTSTNNANSPRLPRATKVREIARPPDQPDGVTNWGCAAGSGHVCLVWDSANDEVGSVHIVRAAEDQTVVCQRMNATNNPRELMRAVCLSDRFLILGTNTARSSLELARFILASDESVTNVATGLFSGATITTYAACRVAGSDEFVVIAQVGANLITRRFNASGAQQIEYSTIAVTATQVCIEASSTANQVVIGYVVGANDTWVTYNLTTGASVATRSVFAGTDDVLNLGVARMSSTQLMLTASIDEATASDPDRVEKATWIPSTDTQGLVAGFRDMRMVSTPVFTTETFFASQWGAGTVGGTPNLLLSLGTDTGDVTPQLAKDFEVADTTSALLPEIAFDSSTSKYYWANATANPDGTTTPQITEFELSSTERRQVAVLGNLAYIAGGVPLVFDGRTVVESGFLVRPRIISLTGSNSTGKLINGAEYDYRLHYEWIDCENNLHLSPPSAISTITLGASDDTVTANCAAPHSMRSNNGAASVGGSHSLVLSRTLGTVTRTAPSLFGRAVVDPPSSSLNGLDLLLFVEDETGSQLFTITFDAGSVDTDAIVTDINAVTTGRITASNQGGAVLLTLDDSGEGNFLWVYGGTAIDILGFVANEFAEGTTSIVKGENFQRAAVAYTVIAGISGAFRLVVDTRKDQSDPIVDSDLIRQQPLYSSGVASGAHHAPPPSEYIWAGRERVVVNHPRRAKFTSSKLVVPSEPAEFAAEGFIAFSGQVTGDIEALAVVGDSIVLWTRREIWEVTGSGPGRNGIGEFFAARRISNAGGIVADGWRSLVETDEGVFFQRQATQLCMLTKAGSVEWVGRAIEDYLELYPEITAAVYVPSRHSVAFSCQNALGTLGGILRYDLDAKAWFFDDVGAVAALAEYQGRLAYVQAGVVYVQDELPGTGTAVEYSLKTNMFQGFQTIGHGQLNRIGFLGTYRGPCTVNLYYSSDGVDYTTLIGTWTLADADFDPGDRIVELKDPPAQMTDSFGLLYEVVPQNGSEGVWMHAVAVDVTGSAELARRGPVFNL
jgi:hypothetical protein